jgi:hypothetical protein
MSVTTTLETATVTTQLGADGVSTTVDGSTVEVTTGGGEVVVTALQGAAGTAGKSAYQIAVDNGYVGTEAEWIASIGSTWGTITGTLSSQTDLQTAINSKANLSGGNTFTGDQTFNQGRVGLGDTSPTYKMEVRGSNATTDNSAALRVQGFDGAGNASIRLMENTGNTDNFGFSMEHNAADNRFYLRNHNNSVAGTVAISVDRTTANVGVGTNAPATKLHITDTTAPTIRIDAGAASIADPTLQFHSDGEQRAFILADRGAGGGQEGFLAFATHPAGGPGTPATERMRIDPNGRVGIGTTVPTSALDVSINVSSITPALHLNNSSNGSDRGPAILFSSSAVGYGTSLAQIGAGGDRSLRFQTGNGAWTLVEAMRLTTDGNLGIGTTSPTSKLHVVGDSTVTGTVNGLTLRTQGSSGIGIGASALGSTTGQRNVAIGLSAGQLLTTGEFNNFLGTFSGYDVSSGSNNTMIGHNTGRGITTGSWNTVVGANVTGLTAALTQNIILADGLGNIRAQCDNSARWTLGTGVSASGDASLSTGKTNIALIRVHSTNNAGIAGVQFQGAGDRGSIYGTSGYEIHIEPNAQFGQADIIMNPKNGTTMNVGIGTAAPTAKLHVVGTGLITGGALVGTAPDLITNGTFATDTSWNKGTGWTISSNVANGNIASGFAQIDQSLPSLVEGQAYELTFTVNVVSGGVAAFLGSSGSAEASFGSAINASGTYTRTVVCPVGQPKVLLIRANNDFTGTIDNVSLRAVATADRLSVIGNVAAAGTVTGSNLSGTNTGDETGAGILTKLAGVSGGGTTNFLRADGTFAAPPAGGGGGTWGSITGTLSNQTDLQAALNAKANTSHTHAIADVTGLQTALDGKLNLTGGSISGDIDLGYGDSVGLFASSDRGTFGGASYANYGLTFGFVATGDTDPTTALAGFGGVRLLTGGAPRLTITSSGTVAIASSTLTVGGRNVLNDIDGKQPLATVLTNTTASFTTAQETKLAGIATGATANATDAQLRDRATHTGSQAISTVTGLQTALDGKQAAGTYATGTGTASGTNTGDETYSTITTKLAGGSGGGTTNFLRADGTFAAPPSGGSVSWGGITGTLSSQTDLQTALNGKANTTHTHVIADVTGLQTALDAKAPTASPTLTGTVTANTITSAAATVLDVTATGGMNLSVGTGNLSILPRASGNTGMAIYSNTGTTPYLEFFQDVTLRGSVLHSNARNGMALTSTGSAFVDGVSGANLQFNGTTRLSTTSTGVSVTGTLSSTGTLTAPNIATNLSVFCSGNPDANEVIGGAIMPVAFTVTQGNCVAKATVAATASTVFTILKDGVTVGTCTFAAAATTGTFSITAGGIAANQHLYIQAPTTPDATLANISMLVRA